MNFGEAIIEMRKGKSYSVKAGMAKGSISNWLQISAM